MILVVPATFPTYPLQAMQMRENKLRAVLIEKQWIHSLNSPPNSYALSAPSRQQHEAIHLGLVTHSERVSAEAYSHVLQISQ